MEQNVDGNLVNLTGFTTSKPDSDISVFALIVHGSSLNFSWFSLAFPQKQTLGPLSGEYAAHVLFMSFE